jgi:hypothetical protein
MKRRLFTYSAIVALCSVALGFFFGIADAETRSVERTFRSPKKTIEKALKQLQPALSGHLPTLEGFVLVGDRPLTRYQRAFYQCTAQVNETPQGSVVRISANVTAWFQDASSAHSGYQLLTSNGRLETDLLDQLSDQLSAANSGETSGEKKSAGAADTSKAESSATSNLPIQSDLPVVSTPLPNAPESPGTILSATANALPLPSERPQASDKVTEKKSLGQHAEVSSLEEAIRNQSRPKNLVAIKKSGTPVVGSPSLSGKTLFLADAQDEFEMLDFNADWVHVRISGLSRGWIWRTSLEMPEGISDVPTSAENSGPTAADLFQVSREEMAPFPGDWAPLRGQSVKIISVQKIREDEKGGGAGAKLEFAKSMLDSSYDELAKTPDVAGMVLIFDSVDGGMIAATLPTIRKWKAGGLSDAALWHQCYFDPPETFTISSAASGH